jgi:signal transduction histidine kinase
VASSCTVVIDRLSLSNGVSSTRRHSRGACNSHGLSDLGFELSSLSLLVEGEARDRLLVTVSRVDDLIRDLRRLVFTPLGRRKSRAELEAWFESLAREGAAQLRCRSEVVIDGDLDEVPALIARHARAVASELVHNAIAHSRASWLELYVGVGASEVEVRVTDDGLGAEEDPAQGKPGAMADPMPGSGLGLDSVRARARELHGRFTLTVTAEHDRIARWHVPFPPSPTVGDD